MMAPRERSDAKAGARKTPTGEVEIRNLVAHDNGTSIRELKDRVAEFARERDWERFHSPKNLSMALAAEVGELLELFQWKSEEQSWAAQRDGRMRVKVREELADIAIFLLNLCNQLEIDLASSIAEKMQQNARRYPADVVRGKAKGSELIGDLKRSAIAALDSLSE